MAIITALFLFHFTLYSFWVIEDAAISYAFARNWAAGDGFVANLGGLPVEGFSNPSWTLLLGVLSWFGVSPWVAAKVVGALCGWLSLLLAVRWTRQIMPGAAPLWHAVAPLTLALSPQFVLWCASGLENPLYILCAAYGATSLVSELRGGLRSTWRSALSFSVVALTRPDGALIALIAGLFALAVASSTLTWRQTGSGALRWLCWALTPVLAWQAYRLATFGWALPNTYYAKLVVEDRFTPWGWNINGWRYLRNYGMASLTAFMLPLYILGATGFRRWRSVIGLVCAMALAVGLLVTAEWSLNPKLTESWRVTIILTVLACLILPGLVGIGRNSARTLAWLLCLCTVGFTLYAGGDWMKGYRWVSLMVVPLAILFADALYQLHCWLPKYKNTTAAILLIGPLVASIVGVGYFLSRPETTPFDVHRRVKLMQNVQDRLHLDEASLLEVDMGAHMWWSGFTLVDMAGLVNVPIAHSGYEKPFIRAYIYDTIKPTFAHVHGSWAKKTKMTAHAGWRQYVDVGAYPISPWTAHPGAHIRRDLIAVKRWTHDDRTSVLFSNGFRVEGFKLPAPQTRPGGHLFVEVGMTRSHRTAHTRLYLILENDDFMRTWDIPPAYDWLNQKTWRSSETIVGRHTISMPKDMPVGVYSLRFMAIDEDGVSAVQKGPALWPDVVTVGTPAAVTGASVTAQTTAITAASADDCATAEELFDAARRHHPFRSEDAVAIHANVGPHIARCFARKPNVTPNQLQRARWFDHDNADVQHVGLKMAKEQVLIASNETDPAARLALLKEAAAFDPTDPHLRREIVTQRVRMMEGKVTDDALE